MISLDVLRTVEILQGLTDKELSKVRRCGEEVALRGDTTVFKDKASRYPLKHSLLDGRGGDNRGPGTSIVWKTIPGGISLGCSR